MTRPPSCEVCGAPATTVRQSVFPIPASGAYCQRCDDESLEPLSFVRAYLALSDNERAERLAMTSRSHNLDQVVARSLTTARVDGQDTAES